MATTTPADALLSRFPETDDVPLDSAWHRDQINLLVDLTRRHFRSEEDWYVAGNMFVYWDPKDPRKSSGPDYMFIRGVPRRPERRIWAVWIEGGHFPNMIVELMSPRTKNKDRKTNKAKYAQVFHTPDYFFYDPETGEFRGWRLAGDDYEPLTPNEQGRFWSEELGLWLGTWYGEVDHYPEALWLRFFHPDGGLVLALAEVEQERAAIAQQRAEAAQQRADAAQQRAETAQQQAETALQRADAAEAEVARLKALLADRASGGETS